MFTIDLILKYSPVPVSVQRKEEDDARSLHQSIKDAMRGEPQLLELTCEKQTDKQVALMSDQISAAIVSQKSATATGRPPGFLAIAE
ncbi:MAG: hypothetical protein HC838_01645 [Spirulinaceae cyanobacterium RM2_2_10]|nr:hypothetical protein [Spirulinaceae cyanobacterium SM2_1_0]NJO19026.1 hypothetical protein [Spirulinaceae cyanobacterium RM2_2_10]